MNASIKIMMYESPSNLESNPDLEKKSLTGQSLRNESYHGKICYGNNVVHMKNDQNMEQIRPNIKEVYVKCDMVFKLLVNSTLGYCGGL